MSKTHVEVRAVLLLVALLLVWAWAASADHGECVAWTLPSGGPGHCAAYGITASFKAACDHQELVTASQEWARWTAPSIVKALPLRWWGEDVDWKDAAEQRWRRAVAACTN